MLIKTIKTIFPFIIAIILSLTACSKDDIMGSDSKAIKNLPGSIYWYFAGEVGYMDFGSGKYNDKWIGIGPGNSRYDSYDISWDNKKTLLTMDVEGAFNFTERRFVLRDKGAKMDYSSLQDGKNVFDITYEADDIEITDAHISPNEKYLVLDAQHFADMPITIIDAANGNFINSWYVKGVSFLNYGIPVWTADNTVFFRIGNSVYKSSAADGFKTAPNVFTQSGISSVTVNPQGTKLAFRKDRHLWMCDIDGRDMKQITTSELSEVISYDGEHRPTFSPDGNYIAFTGASKGGTPWSDHDYADGSWVASVGGKYGYIVIIPADGKMYDLEKKDSGAIWLKQPDADYAGVPCSANLIWR